MDVFYQQQSWDESDFNFCPLEVQYSLEVLYF